MRNILHIERAREWERAQAACRLAFSPYGQPRGCYTARPESKWPPLSLLKATRIDGDVPRLAAARTSISLLYGHGMRRYHCVFAQTELVGGISGSIKQPVIGVRLICPRPKSKVFIVSFV